MYTVPTSPHLQDLSRKDDLLSNIRLLMAIESLAPEVGQIVLVRQRRYLVEQAVLPVKSGDSSLVTLSCVDDDAQAQQLEVLWERELDAQILSTESWDQIASRGFDPQDRFAAYLNVLRWNCVTSTDPTLLQSPFRAGIRLDAYQLEPLRSQPFSGH